MPLTLPKGINLSLVFIEKVHESSDTDHKIRWKKNEWGLSLFWRSVVDKKRTHTIKLQITLTGPEGVV